MRQAQQQERRQNSDRLLSARLIRRASGRRGLGVRLATNAKSLAEALDRHLNGLLDRAGPVESQADRSEGELPQGGRHGIDR